MPTTSPAWMEVRERVLRFVEDRVYPLESRLDAAARTQRAQLMSGLMHEAKSHNLWALGHPREIGGHGMPFLDYVHVNEVIGRSYYANQALGTLSLQDALMLQRHAAPAWRTKYLAPIVAGDFVPGFAMTEPEVAGSDPTQLRTHAQLVDDCWVITGHKWFITGAADAAFITVMCRTETDAPAHGAFSMIIVPTDAPGVRIVRETPVLGLEDGHCEILLEQVRVPRDHLLGPRGQGFQIAQQRLGPGRIFHCMRWLGQAQRAFDLMCRRLNDRVAFGEPLAHKQLLQGHVFESAAEIQASRLLTLNAARLLDAGAEAREEIGIIKVIAARMLQNVIDRAIQVYGARGLTPDTPLERMYRHARAARIYDGPDEVHIQSVARRLLRSYRAGEAGADFGVR